MSNDKDKCEGCEKPATHLDSEGVPLCDECYAALPVETPETDEPFKEVAQLELELAAAKAERDDALKQARLGWERHAEKDRAYGEALAERDRLREELAAKGRKIDQLHDRVEKLAAAADEVLRCYLNEKRVQGHPYPEDMVICLILRVAIDAARETAGRL